MLDTLKRLIREPLLHFLLIGGAIYALYGIRGGGDDNSSENTITVTSGEIQSLADQWSRVWSRPPTNEEMKGIIRDHVRIKILYREAVAMGLDAGDVVIERRLAQRLEFVAQDLLTPREPSDEVLAEWYSANSDSFKQPDLYSLTQIYFNSDVRGENTVDDAKAMLDRLNALDESPGSYDDYGDRIMLPSYFPETTEFELRKQFGAEFVDRVIDLDPGTWHGPVTSGYGVHLVLIHDVRLAVLPNFDEIKERAQAEWMSEQISELSDRFMDNLMSRYEVVIEEADLVESISRMEASP
jgi:peptidyl-prolyl cis-trans isomerase C